jgi:CTP synthase (UTP-ammonia lyase)
VIRIGVVGDYDPNNETHQATDAALAHASGAVGAPAMGTWIGTGQLAGGDVGALERFDCLLIAPGSPYLSTEGALAAIRYAREADVPVLGTCGGFQHMVLEIARHVLGYEDAGHAETNPHGPRLVITALSCSLKGQVMPVRLAEGSVAAAAYGTTQATERYYCDFGLNQDYVSDLARAGLVVSGTGPEGEPRVVEAPRRRFFVGALFVPQASSRPASPAPLVVALLAATRSKK